MGASSRTACPRGVRSLPLCLPGSLRAFARAAHRLRLLTFYSAGTRETRKPRRSFPRLGTPESRIAERQYLAVPIQLPPRFTRPEPDAGPLGSSAGEFP